MTPPEILRPDGPRLVDARWAGLTCQRLSDADIPLAPVLDLAGLRLAQIGDPKGRIPFYKHASLLTAAARASDDRSFALRLAASLTPRQAGPLGFIALSSATLGDALKNFRRYQRVLSEGIDTHMEEDGPRRALCSQIADPRVVDPTQAIEFVIGAGLTLCRRLAGPPFQVARIEFSHGRQGRPGDYQALLGVPVRFGQGRNALIVESAMLELPLATADDLLLQSLLQLCHQILGDPPDGEDLVYRVRQQITELLPTGEPTLERVARALAMSERTLSRRLSERNTSYRTLLDQTRHQLALSYLKRPALRSTQIAYLLGYAEPSGFHHAFNRWTGQTPSRYRSGGAAS